MQDDDNLSNLVESGFDPKLNFVAQYSKCFYRSTLVLTTISNIEPPASSFEKIYMIVSYMIGVIVFAIIVGSITEIIDDLNMKQSEFQKNVDLIKSFMHVASVERTLQQRVINWFNHSWMVNNGMDEQLIFQESLPENLQAEIAINVHLETLKRVHIFQDCEPGLLKQLVTRLKLQVFSPGDFICRKGDIGREMYFVKSGKLSVVSDDGATVFVNLEEGSYFGEISILDIPGNKTGNRRTANVKSSGYSDLFCLTKADLWQALDEYPLAKKALIEKGKSLLRKDNLIDEDEAAEAEKLEHKKSMLEDDLYMLRFELDHVEQRLAKINSFVQTGADLLNKRIDRLENKLKTLH